MICSHQNTTDLDAVEPLDPCHATWSVPRTRQLLEHHALGLSAALSAQLIGGVTRNAVISKRRRLGLLGANPLRAALRIVGGTDPARPSTRLPISRRARPDRDEPSRRGEPLPFMDWPAPPDARPKTLAAREVRECAWPLGPAQEEGDYRTLFCCAPVESGRPYCAVHHARAVLPDPEPEDLPSARGKPR